MILVCAKHFTEINKSHGGLTENVPFTNRFIAQMLAYTMIDVNSEKGQSVI